MNSILILINRIARACVCVWVFVCKGQMRLVSLRNTGVGMRICT